MSIRDESLLSGTTHHIAHIHDYWGFTELCKMLVSSELHLLAWYNLSKNEKLLLAEVYVMRSVIEDNLLGTGEEDDPDRRDDGADNDNSRG